MGRKKVWLVVIFMVLVIGGVVTSLFSDVGISANVGAKKTNTEVEALLINEPKDIILKIDWEIEKDFILQVFYTKHRNEVFNQKSSLRRKVGPKDKHIEIVLPAEKIYRIRYDFGSNPGKVILKKVEISGDQYINFSNWNEYRYFNIEKNKIHKEDNTLELVSSHRDPYMSFIYPFVLYKNSDKLVKNKNEILENNN